MSLATSEGRAFTPPDIASRKGKTPLACLTAYTTPIARLIDPHCDVVSVRKSAPKLPVRNAPPFLPFMSTMPTPES